jgi:L-threonylcarbamoyladenylate synthase
VVVYPTETFYGLAADALSLPALARLAAAKGRGADKALSLLVDDSRLDAALAGLVAEVPPLARRLIAAHWPGPLTIALPARGGLPPPIVSSGFVAVRASPHPVARALVAAFGGPITATSANLAGAPPSTTAAGAAGAFPGCLVLDGGETPGGAPSTLVRVAGDRLEVLRQGAIQVSPAP